MKKESSGAGVTLMKTKNSGSGAGAMFIETKSSGAGAVSFLRQRRSHEIIHTVAGHIDDPE